MHNHILSFIYYPLSVICRHRRPGPLSTICRQRRLRPLSVICRSHAAPSAICRIDGRSRRCGFTLIEIMVAITILLVIVIMGSMVFQETTGAFQSGTERVKRQVAVRNAIGAISHDLSLAVANETATTNHYNGRPSNNFGANTISFIALTGTPGFGFDGKSNSVIRTAQEISYSLSGSTVKRKVSALKCDKGKWSVVETKETRLNDSSDPVDDLSFDVDWGDNTEQKPDLPERITIRAGVTGKTSYYSVGAGSMGRDGRWDASGTPAHARNDIYVGYDPNNGN